MRVIICLALTATVAQAGKPPPAPDDEPSAKPAAKPKPKPKQITPTTTRPLTARAPDKKKPAAPVELVAVNLHEQLSFKPIPDDKTRKAKERAVTRLFRCWHTGKTHAVDQRLARAMWEAARHFGKSRVELYSAYRPKAYCTLAHSRHLNGRAVDFRIPGVQNETLIAWLRQRFHPAGVGYYPNGVHVHLDFERGHDTYWIDAGDAPSGRRTPIAAVGDTSPGAFEETSDEITNAVALPDAPAPGTTEPLADPPASDPAFDL